MVSSQTSWRGWVSLERGEPCEFVAGSKVYSFEVPGDDQELECATDELMRLWRDDNRSTYDQYNPQELGLTTYAHIEALS
jgi:hypothetical protein